MKLLKQLLHFIWKQYEIVLLKFCEAKVNLANNERNEKIQTLEEIRGKYEMANKELHEKLKVSYGYCNNNSLLDIVLKGAAELKQNIETESAYDWLDKYEVVVSVATVSLIMSYHFYRPRRRTREMFFWKSLIPWKMS